MRFAETVVRPLRTTSATSVSGREFGSRLGGVWLGIRSNEPPGSASSSTTSTKHQSARSRTASSAMRRSVMVYSGDDAISEQACAREVQLPLPVARLGERSALRRP